MAWLPRSHARSPPSRGRCTACSCLIVGVVLTLWVAQLLGNCSSAGFVGSNHQLHLGSSTVRETAPGLRGPLGRRLDRLTAYAEGSSEGKKEEDSDKVEDGEADAEEEEEEEDDTAPLALLGVSALGVAGSIAYIAALGVDTPFFVLVIVVATLCAGVLLSVGGLFLVRLVDRARKSKKK
eukprot:TRINITY_DN103110_c0_g1_i1.p1 TRINITY_DN103110_c0_g1~~TRINITY_DN103110_c0_g1_i1.p1  ORF type:complete len:180 (+),score=27.23 TRINITY_DN103110_c0_g1_i1:114-653(+)